MYIFYKMSDIEKIKNKYINEVVKNMSNKDECYQIFNYYSGKTGYKHINQFLLMDENEELFVKKYKQDINFIKRCIEEIDECFNKAPVTKDDEFVLWRGMDKDLGLTIGNSIVLKNYTSCSYNLGVARDFTEENRSKRGKVIGECCLYAMHIGEGIPYLPLEKYSKAGPLEGEVILPRNLVMTYINDETIGKTGKYKFIPYKTTVRHMKITKLNDKISDNKIIDMSEPIIHKEEEKIKISVKPIKEKKKRTQKNKELSPISNIICPEGCIPKKGAIKDKNIEPKNQDFGMGSIGVSEGSKSAIKVENPMGSHTKQPMSKESSIQAPFEETNLNSMSRNPTTNEKKKRCPKGTRKNKDGLCIKT